MKNTTEGKSYTYSKYNLYHPDYPTRGYELIYNTLTGNMNINKQEYRSEGNVFTGGSDVERKNVLIEDGIIVTSDEDENVRLLEYFDKLSRDKTCYSFNIRFCPDKSEPEVPDEYAVMDMDTAEQTAAWICQCVDDNEVQNVQMCIYGIDNLASTMLVDYMVSELSNFCRFKEINLTFGLCVGAMYEITPGKLARYRYRGLAYLEYVVDNYMLENRQEVYIENISNRISKTSPASGTTVVKITVRPELTRLYEKLFLALYAAKTQNLIVDFLPDCVKSGEHEDLQDKGDDSLDYLVGMLRLAKKLDFGVAEHFRSGLPCSGTMRQRFVIDYKGDLYRCVNTSMTHDREYVVGNVADGITVSEDDSCCRRRWECCAECVYVPLCGGGCAYSKGTGMHDGCRLLYDKLLIESIVSGMDRQQIMDGILFEEREKNF